jgi:hypothetical protein
VPYCFECGKELAANQNKCAHCGWASEIQKNPRITSSMECPDCLRIGKSKRQCGVCRQKWYCSWCHNQRRNHSFKVISSTKDKNKTEEEKATEKEERDAENELLNSHLEGIRMQTIGKYGMRGYGYGRAEGKAHDAVLREMKRWHRSSLASEKKRKKQLEREYKAEIDRWEPCLKCATNMFGNFQELPGYNLELMREIVDSVEFQSEFASILHDKIGEEVLIKYSNSSNNDSERKIIPKEIGIYNNGFEYVIAHCLMREEERHFRLDRIKSIAELQS